MLFWGGRTDTINCCSSSVSQIERWGGVNSMLLFYIRMVSIPNRAHVIHSTLSLPMSTWGELCLQLFCKYFWVHHSINDYLSISISPKLEMLCLHRLPERDFQAVTLHR
jgi:hypothetical protein